MQQEKSLQLCLQSHLDDENFKDRVNFRLSQMRLKEGQSIKAKQ